jgi:hypothetical protein
MGDRLVEQREAIAHRAVGCARDQHHGLGRDLDLLLRGDAVEMCLQHIRRHAAQVEALAAREHRDRHLAQLRGGKDELHMRRRLLQRLQQSVEGVVGQHVHFVDDVHLVARRHRAVAHALDQLAHVVDTGVGGRVLLDHIDVAVLGDGGAVLANAAGIDRGPALAVPADAIQRAGDDARGGGLAHAADAREHEGVRKTPRFDGIAQGTHHRVLADQGGEIARPVLAGQHVVRKTGVGRFSHRVPAQPRLPLQPSHPGDRPCPRPRAEPVGTGPTRSKIVTAASFRT